jgi:hypothetical protein
LILYKPNILTENWLNAIRMAVKIGIVGKFSATSLKGNILYYSQK